MSLSNSFALSDVLGWTAGSVGGSPVTLLLETPGTAQDLLVGLFTAHKLSVGHTVCFIGVRNTFQHYLHVCRKQDTQLDKLQQGGRFFFIDCLQSGTESLDEVLAKIIVCKQRWQSLQQAGRFVIVCDDLSQQLDLHNTTQSSGVAFCDSLLKILIPPELLGASSSHTPVSGELGHLLVSCTVHPAAAPEGSTSLSSQPQVLQASLSALTAVNRKLLPTTTHHYDLPQSLGGLPMLLANKILQDALPLQTEPNLLLELRPLTGGYNASILAEQHIRKGTSRMATTPSQLVKTPQNAAVAALIGKSAIVYLSLEGDGKIACHTKG